MTLSISTELGSETPHPAIDPHVFSLSNRLNWLRRCASYSTARLRCW